MEQATQIVSKLSFNPGQQDIHNNQNQALNQQQTEKIINRVFEQLQAIRPAWKLSLPDGRAEAMAKKEWTKAFIKNGILSFEQLRLGFDKARSIDDKYFPDPGTFIKWCTPQPEDLGLPEPATAYHEACKHAHELTPSKAKWSHQAVYEAAKQTGFFELKSMAEKHILPVFTRNYDIITKKILKGEPISDIPKALPGQVQQTIAERNKAYHDEQQKKQLQEKGLDQLNNPKAAMNEIYRMLGRQ
ncbi:replication protein P [Spartinivicinus marinus]|nr:replication protein P [Spartinivicinus marinus]MCX4026982.1 replication protein P [Spartinivicinus marinus]